MDLKKPKKIGAKMQENDSENSLLGDSSSDSSHNLEKGKENVDNDKDKMAQVEKTEKNNSPRKVPSSSTILETTTETGTDTVLDRRGKLYEMKTIGGNLNGPVKIEFQVHKPRINKKICKQYKRPIRKFLLGKNSANSSMSCRRKSGGLSFLQKLQMIFGRSSKMDRRRKKKIFKNDSSYNEDLCTERIDIFYFEQGNYEYFRTTDYPPQLLTEMLADQTKFYATRFWAEIFGSFQIAIIFLITFILQVYRFLLNGVLQPILVGFIQITSDYLFKPLITIVFNGVFQPPLIFLFNIFSMVRDIFKPIGEILQTLMEPFIKLLRALKFISITNVKNVKGEEKVKQKVEV